MIVTGVSFAACSSSSPYGVPHRQEPRTSRRVVEHPDPARCLCRQDALRRVPAKSGHRAQYAHTKTDVPGRGGHAGAASVQRATAAKTNTCSPSAAATSAWCLVLLAFGHRHFAVEGGARIVDSRTGATVEPMLVDQRTGEPVIEPRYAIVRGKASCAANTARSKGGAGLLAAATPSGRAAKAARL